MNKILLSAAVALSTASLSAAEVSYQWARTLESGNTVQIDQILAGPDNTTYAITHVKASGEITWGGQTLDFDFSNAVATNDPLLLMKLDDKGDIVWTITSTEGDFVGLSEMPMAVTADGGVVFATKVRTFSGQENNTNVCVIRDASGTEISVANKTPGLWAYQGIVVKADAGGNVEWIRQIVPTDGKLTNTLSFNGVAVGPNDRIYIAGQFSGSFRYEDSEEFQPVNADATGKFTGDAILFALDSDGKLAATLRPEGNETYATADQMSLVAANRSGVYVIGMATTNGRPYTLGGQTVELTDGLPSIYAARLDEDLTVEKCVSLTTIPNSASKAVIQSKNIIMSDELIAYSGAVNGGLKADDLTIEGGNTALHGFTILFDGDLTAKRAVVTTTSISANNGAIIDTAAGHLYCYGYNMTSPSLVYLNSYPIDSAENEPETISLVEGQGATTSFGCAFDNSSKRLVINFRSNKPADIMGHTCPETLSRFSSTLASFSTPDIARITGIAADKPAVTLVGGRGELTLYGSVPVEIYNASGLLVKRIDATPEGTTVTLPSGLYLTSYGKVICY
ncbi:MAG: hypothetical protein NC336_07295 [Clostridium sp.]|nr:hypothetical protein [Clostridium sp.]